MRVKSILVIPPMLAVSIEAGRVHAIFFIISFSIINTACSVQESPGSQKDILASSISHFSVFFR